MFWTIEFSYAVLLTSFTGSILFLAWKLVERALEKAGLVSLGFGLLKAVAVGFFLPVAFFFLKGKGERREIGNGYLFLPTYGLLWAGKIFMAVWAVGGLFFLLRLAQEGWRLHRKTRDAFPCETPVCALFDEVYRNLGGKGSRLKLCMSYRFVSPCMCGVLRPRVILPVREYREEELRVILTHEIIHYLQGDAVFKWGILLLRTLHFFNPLAWSLCREGQKWGEYVCDLRACRTLGGAKRYFQVIADIAIGASEEALAAQLLENKNELVERIERMKRMKRNKNMKFGVKAAAVALAAAAFAAGSVSVYAATLKSADGYKYLYHLTDYGVEEEYIPWVNDHEEYTESGTAEGIVVRTGEVNQLTRSVYGLEWTVNGGELVETEAFSCKKDDTISVDAYLNPNNMTVKIGIILPNGNKRYIWGKGAMHHQFAVSSAGEYKVFVENGSKTSVSVSSCYMVY